MASCNTANLLQATVAEVDAEADADAGDAFNDELVFSPVKSSGQSWTRTIGLHSPCTRRPVDGVPTSKGDDNGRPRLGRCLFLRIDDVEEDDDEKVTTLRGDP